MRLSPAAKLVIESGILVGLLTGAGIIATVIQKQEAQGSEISELKQDHKLLAEKLVTTQIKMAEDIAEIKTTLKQQSK